MRGHNGIRTTLADALRRLACRIDGHARVVHGYCRSCETDLGVEP